MATRKTTRRGRPATTPEARENQLISLSYDLAEKQLREGSATSQVQVHFLKLGTERERLEREKLQHENLLLAAKRDQLASAKRVEELYEQALVAMREYTGQELEHYDEDDYYDDR